MSNLARIGVAVTLFLAVTSVSCLPMPGQRLLTVQGEADGNVVFEGVRGVPDSTPVSEMWDVLGDVRFESTVKETEPPTEALKNDRAIQGAIVVRIKHVNDELANASLGKLTLRHDDEEDAWRLDRAEIERIKVAAKE